MPSSSKKSTYLPKKSEIKIKQEPTSNLTLSNISHFNNHSLQNSQNSQNTQIRLLKPQQKLLVPKNKLACQINVQQRPLGGSNSETDEEDWIKANIIKVEPRNEANSIIIKTEQPKPPEKVIKMVQVAKKRPNTSGMVTVQSKKIALDSEYMKVNI